MSDLSNALDIASSGLRGQAERIRFLSENIANADTPGYRRKTISFSEQTGLGATRGAIEVDRVTLDKRDLTQIHDPSHPLADASGYYSGSNVDLIIEIADAREAQRSYSANLKVFDQTRQMSSELMDLLRR